MPNPSELERLADDEWADATKPVFDKLKDLGFGPVVEFDGQTIKKKPVEKWISDMLYRKGQWPNHN